MVARQASCYGLDSVSEIVSCRCFWVTVATNVWSFYKHLTLLSTVVPNSNYVIILVRQGKEFKRNPCGTKFFVWQQGIRPQLGLLQLLVQSRSGLLTTKERPIGDKTSCCQTKNFVPRELHLKFLLLSILDVVVILFSIIILLLQTREAKPTQWGYTKAGLPNAGSVYVGVC